MDRVKFFITGIELTDLQVLAEMADFEYDAQPIDAIVNGENVVAYFIGPVDFDLLFEAIKQLDLTCRLIFRKGEKRFQIYRPAKKGARASSFVKRAQAIIEQIRQQKENALMN